MTYWISPSEEGWSWCKVYSVPSTGDQKRLREFLSCYPSLQGQGYGRAMKEVSLGCLAFCLGCLEMGLWERMRWRMEPLTVLREQSTSMLLRPFVRPRNCKAFPRLRGIVPWCAAGSVLTVQPIWSLFFHAVLKRCLFWLPGCFGSKGTAWGLTGSFDLPLPP